MSEFDNKRSLGHEPWWRQMLYVAEINAAYLWRKLWRRA